MFFSNSAVVTSTVNLQEKKERETTELAPDITKELSFYSYSSDAEAYSKLEFKKYSKH